METLSNFASIYCYISFVIGAVIMLVALAIAAMGKEKEPRNKVRFYVARDRNGSLWVYLNKPIRRGNTFDYDTSKGLSTLESLEKSGLNPIDFNNLKWEDEPVEVFINLED